MATGKLSAKQELFIKEYLVDLNATQAAIRAGYSEKTAQEQSSRLLSNVIIKRKVQEAMDARAQRVEQKSDKVLEELARLGYADIRELFDEDGSLKPVKEWPADLAKAVASFEVVEDWELTDHVHRCSDCQRNYRKVLSGYIKKVKMWNKPQALELLGKNQKLFTEKVDITGQVTLEEIVAGPKEEKK